jgi:type I restriction enzyme, S subunit
MIRQRTYGSVVQHIKPDHLDQIPVPFPDAAQQRHIHNLIERASVARTQAGQLLDEASGYFDELVGRLRHTHEHQLSLGVVRRSALRKTRLDAFTHTGWAADAVVVEGDPFSVLGDVVSPNIRKRIFAERGTPFVSGVDIFQLRPTARARLRAGEAARTGALIGTGQLVVQRAGQRYGLLGRPAFVGRRLDGWACSQDLIRIVPRSSRTTGRIFAFLRSEAGRRQLVAQSSGTSIPAINSESLTDLVVPPLPAELVDKANEALKLREQADADEELAIWEVERWLA